MGSRKPRLNFYNGLSRSFGFTPYRGLQEAPVSSPTWALESFGFTSTVGLQKPSPPRASRKLLFHPHLGLRMLRFCLHISSKIFGFTSPWAFSKPRFHSHLGLRKLRFHPHVDSRKLRLHIYSGPLGSFSFTLGPKETSVSPARGFQKASTSPPQ